ncbi:8658_t:CDS:2, partial [Cetraspora pellucida]
PKFLLVTMPVGRSCKNIGPCTICGKHGLKERFRILTPSLLSKAMQSLAALNLKVELNLNDQLCHKHYTELVKMELSKLDATIRACDESLLFRDGYRHLAAIEPQLIREHQ